MESKREGEWRILTSEGTGTGASLVYHRLPQSRGPEKFTSILLSIVGIVVHIVGYAITTTYTSIENARALKGRTNVDKIGTSVSLKMDMR